MVKEGAHSSGLRHGFSASSPTGPLGDGHRMGILVKELTRENTKVLFAPPWLRGEMRDVRRVGMAPPTRLPCAYQLITPRDPPPRSIALCAEATRFAVPLSQQQKNSDPLAHSGRSGLASLKGSYLHDLFNLSSEGKVLNPPSPDSNVPSLRTQAIDHELTILNLMMLFARVLSARGELPAFAVQTCGAGFTQRRECKHRDNNTVSPAARRAPLLTLPHPVHHSAHTAVVAHFPRYHPFEEGTVHHVGGGVSWSLTATCRRAML